MKRPEFTIRLEGVNAHDAPAAVVRDLCDLLVEGSRRCARLAAEGRSVARGAAPEWAASVADVRIHRFVSGSLVLEVDAPRLVDVAPDAFSQASLFSGPIDADATALDLLFDAATDAGHAQRDSERLDAGVLEVLGRMGSLFARGGTRLTVTRAGRPEIAFDSSTVQACRTLAAQTPEARTTRVRGLLDAATVTSRSFTLRITDGRQLRGYYVPSQLEALRPLLGEDVVVEGVTTFRPTGEAFRIEADVVRRAAEGDAVWARLPRVDSSGARIRTNATATSLDALFGQWPGDETDEELAAALACIA